MAVPLSPYENIMEGRHDVPFGDFSWCTRAWEPDPKNEHYKKRTPQQIKKDVLNSQRVRTAIQEMIREGVNEQALWKQAEEILNEMGHNFNMHTVRWFGYVLSKLGKRIYSGIYVNREGVEKLRAAMQDHPVLLMPTHRSYVDFLIISYVFFNYNLPMPIIAAGMDFMAMSFVAERLRDAGAFFMRRSFGNDKLYRAIFAEYVQTHVLKSEAPIEFFVEGTRSRSAKSINPKIGLLSMAVEPFFRGQVADVIVVPITLSYDRTLEESLYAYELLGSSKPRESTSGLVKALRVMDQNYGTLHMHLCEPISLRKFANGQVERALSAPGPPFLHQLSLAESAVVRELSYRVLHEHQRHEAISVFTLAAVVLSRQLALKNRGRPGGGKLMTFEELVEECGRMKMLVERMGGYVAVKREGNLESSLKEAISIHSSVVGLNHQTKEIEVRQIYRHDLGQANYKGHHFSPVTLEAAVTSVLLQHYINKSLHLFVGPAFIVLGLVGVKDDIDKEELFETFRFLRVLLSGDFIFIPGQERQEFEEALHAAERLGVAKCHLVPCGVSPGPAEDMATILKDVLQPFLIAYTALCEVCQNTHQEVVEKDLLGETQAHLEHQLAEGNICHYSSLSLDILRNGIQGLVRLGVVRKSVASGATWVLPSEHNASDLKNRITPFLLHPITHKSVSLPALPVLDALALHRSRAKL